MFKATTVLCLIYLRALDNPVFSILKLMDNISDGDFKFWTKAWVGEDTRNKNA